MNATETPLPDVVIVGSGRAGTGLALALSQGGVAVRIASRGRRGDVAGIPLQPLDALSLPLPASTVLILAVPDRCVREVALALASQQDLAPGVLAVGHVSGALPSMILREAGFVVPTFGAHPLLSFAPADPPSPMPPDTFVTLEGDARALAQRLLKAAGARVVPIRAADKPLCHAAAVLCANLPASLLWLASDILQGCGVSDAPLAATRLLCSMARNLEDAQQPAMVALSGAARSGDRPLQRGLTGPFARGDAATVAMNIAALRQQAPSTAEIYALLGRVLSDRLLREGILSEDTWNRINQELNGPTA